MNESNVLSRECAKTGGSKTDLIAWVCIVLSHAGRQKAGQVRAAQVKGSVGVVEGEGGQLAHPCTQCPVDVGDACGERKVRKQLFRHRKYHDTQTKWDQAASA